MKQCKKMTILLAAANGATAIRPSAPKGAGSSPPSPPAPPSKPPSSRPKTLEEALDTHWFSAYLTYLENCAHPSSGKEFDACHTKCLEIAQKLVEGEPTLRKNAYDQLSTLDQKRLRDAYKRYCNEMNQTMNLSHIEKGVARAKENRALLKKRVEAKKRGMAAAEAHPDDADAEVADDGTLTKHFAEGGQVFVDGLRQEGKLEEASKVEIEGLETEQQKAKDWTAAFLGNGTSEQQAENLGGAAAAATEQDGAEVHVTDAGQPQGRTWVGFARDFGPRKGRTWGAYFGLEKGPVDDPQSTTPSTPSVPRAHAEDKDVEIHQDEDEEEDYAEARRECEHVDGQQVLAQVKRAADGAKTGIAAVAAGAKTGIAVVAAGTKTGIAAVASGAQTGIRVANFVIEPARVALAEHELAQRSQRRGGFEDLPDLPRGEGPSRTWLERGAQTIAFGKQIVEMLTSSHGPPQQLLASGAQAHISAKLVSDSHKFDQLVSEGAYDEEAGSEIMQRLQNVDKRIMELDASSHPVQRLKSSRMQHLKSGRLSGSEEDLKWYEYEVAQIESMENIPKDKARADIDAKQQEIDRLIAEKAEAEKRYTEHRWLPGHDGQAQFQNGNPSSTPSVQRPAPAPEMTDSLLLANFPEVPLFAAKEEQQGAEEIPTLESLKSIGMQRDSSAEAP